MGEYQRISFPLVAGMNTKIEDQAIPAPSLALAYDVQVKKSGGYARRNGFSTMTALDLTGATITGQRAVFPYEDSVVVLNASRSYEFGSTPGRWVDKGLTQPTKLSVTGITAPSDTTPIIVDLAVTSNGYAVYATMETDGAGAQIVKMIVLDAAGTFIGERVLDTAAATTAVKCAAAGVRAWIVWPDTGNVLKTMVFDGTSATTVNASLTSTAPVASTADLGSVAFDIAPKPTDGEMFVAYVSTVPGQIKWGMLNASGALAGTSTYATGVTPGSVACAVESAEVLHGIAYGDNTNPNDLYAIHRSWNGSAWTVTASSGAIDTAMTNGVGLALACLYTNATTLGILYSEINTANSTMHTYRSDYSTAGVATARATTLRHTWLVSKPALYQSQLYFLGYQCGTENPLLPESVDNPTFYLFRQSDGYPMARVSPGVAMPPFSGLAHPTGMTISGAVARLAVLELTRAYDSPDTSLVGSLAVRDARVSFSDTELAKTFEWADSLYLPGGVLLEYDGVSFVESGFLGFATTSSWGLAPSNGAGAMTNSKQYYYIVIPEWTNARGKKHLGTHGGSKSVTMGAADDTVTVTIDTLTATLKQGTRNDFVWGVYRTNDTTPSDNSIFYRVGSIANNPAADVVVFTDLVGDGGAVVQEQFYLGTGELDNVPPPGGHLVASGNGRAAIAGGRVAGNIVTVSKTATDGRGLEFNDALTITTPEEGGAITAMAWLNETLFVFKKERVYRVRGDGPNNLGQGVFAEPELLTSDTGCVHQHSIVAAPDGVFFQGKRGIMLISGTHQIAYIGAPVESPPSPGTVLGTCIDSVLVPKKQQVRFSDGTVTHVYDYYNRLWFVWSAASDGPSCIYSDLHTMPVGNAVWQQSDSVWQDAGTSYFAKVSLAWFSSPASKMENIRIRKVAILGDVKGTSALTVALKYGSLDSTVANHESTGHAVGPLRHTIQPANGVTNQFRVELIDADLTGSPTYTTTEGMVWTEVTFEALVKKGLHTR